LRVYIYIILSTFLFLPPFYPLERELERRITEDTEGAEGARVRIHASRFSFLLFGFCRKVVIETRGLQLRNLRTDKFTVTIKGIRFRPFSTFILGRARVRGAASINWSLRFLDEDLEKYIRYKGVPLSNIQVRIDPQWITLHQPAGIISLFSLPETFTLRGCLKIGEKKDVLLELDRISAFGISPGKTLNTTVGAIINPIVEAKAINSLLARNPIEVLEGVVPRTELENIRLDTGKAVINGSVALVPCESGGPGKAK